MTLTKNKLADVLAAKLEITHKEAVQHIESLIVLIKERLEAGENIKIARFGLFEVKNKHARRGRNPQTGEAITIESRKVISFKPSQVLKQAINQ